MLTKWRGVLLVGLALIVAGVVAIVFSEYSTFAAGTVLGGLLSLAGIVKMVQSFRVQQWTGFIWQELTGAIELVGGILIYLNPMKGALGLTLLIALVFIVQGISQIMLAIKVRDQLGWLWLALAGVVSLLASVVLVVKVPLIAKLEPGTVAGIALLIAGIAYFAVALTVRRGQ